uniref:Uncharacterized protein n=1 Tax=Chromera velia CCMP2878 TaxID=1169474 RepID=A0A0G4H0G3_9ALVE|eukprot:Cvel_24205.t1-p1 / transcript=Cvel_24205.t1 / gene=Cvel_24205 / organism=Chromera_velia_CCMP2878 / gene_product=hypothetical protein / transcript_product=hypothetical protein / location=Cvel_scaffold2586:6277-10804(-) / protein_length=81 / sequence_SO=supercontig / SO=protein_coding / is_pseudo=false
MEGGDGSLSSDGSLEEEAAASGWLRKGGGRHMACGRKWAVVVLAEAMRAKGEKNSSVKGYNPQQHVLKTSTRKSGQGRVCH